MPVIPSVDDYISSARLKWDDYEDCMVAICATKAKADFIITRDSEGFKRFIVSAISPAQMLEILQQDYGLVYDEVDLVD